MKYILLTAITGSVLMMNSSCITSLHPLVIPATVITDNRVVGIWESDGDFIQIGRFTDSELYKDLQKLSPVTNYPLDATPAQKQDDSVMYANGYSVYFKKDGVEYYMFGGLTRIENSIYFDLCPVILKDPKHEESTGYEYTNDYLPGFTMAKLELAGNNTLVLHFVNGDFIKEQLRKGQIRIKHEKDELFDNFLVTASSQELRQFLAKYGHDERLFSKENSITLTRKG